MLISGIAPGVKIGIEYGELDPLYAPDLDCRLLFLGEHLQPLVHAYENLARCFAESGDPSSLAARLESSKEITKYYEIRRNGRLSAVLRDSVFRQQGPFDDRKLRLKFYRAGKSVSHPLPRRRLRALGRLWPLLGSNRPQEEIAALLKSNLPADDAAWAAELLALLETHQLLDRQPRDAGFLRRPAPRVTFMGHTSLLFQSGRSAVLMDPLLPTEAAYARSALAVQQIRLGAICCSHHHWDHCNFQTLMGFDKSTPVIIPRVERPSAFNPPIAGALQMLGFTDIREARLWEPAPIDDIEVIPTPFYGEQDEPGAECDHYTYVLRTKGLTVYGGVDCFRDTFGETVDLMEEIRERYQPQIAFLPISKSVFSYRYGGANGFCRYLDQELVTQSFQYTAGPEEAAEWVSRLRAPVVAPYAIFTFSRWSMPAVVAQFHDALRARGLGERLYPLRPLDSLDLSALAGSRPAGRSAAVTLFRAGAHIRRVSGSPPYRLAKRVMKSLHLA
ncbi:MAG TPA: MBL fold metallo-hydrolase [Bryobacterales bacterium]|jgi:L-ascorbate metabolism protein UlaG (beta-lactamase superfamily)|nr:MBL fold metallo-hydrolase [Bryobacterales bacterium]